MAGKTADKATGDIKTISVQVALQGQTAGQELPSARAYLFDRAGRLVNSQTAGKDPVKFNVAPDQAYRVTVGPDLLAPSKDPPANLEAQLAKANALSQDFVPQGLSAAQLSVHPNIWYCWFPTCINVHGTVSKQLSTGGTATICNGTVQIFQVDLGCSLDSFTVLDFSLFRTRLLDKISLSASVATQASRGQLTSVANTRRVNLAAGASSRISTVSSARANSSSLSLGDVAATIATLDGAALKQFVVANKAILSPYWCELISDFAFCWQELTEVPIQSDGTFSAEICFWCPADYPDLYFEVIQNLSGVDTEVYDPQIACSTYYNYDGSQSVDIVVTDPRAVACLPTSGPGPKSLYVWPTAIGNEPLNGIDGLETLLGTGLLPGTTGPRPFGGTLSLQMLFHPDLRANNIMYYRWSYLFDGDPLPPIVINAPVTHRFQTGFIAPFFVDSYNLGPKTKGPNSNLFEIPDPNVLWVDIVDPEDRPYAYFDSTPGITPTRTGFNTANCGGLAGRSGMVTLILEMFDSAGNFVPCNNARGASTLGDLAGDPGPGAFGFILPQVGGPPNAFDFAPKPNITDHGRLIFRVRVDNNVCNAELPKVATPINSTDTDPCGILQYNNPGDNVAISYVAFHPNNFLDWNLTVSLGVKGIAAEIVPPGPPPTNTSSGSPGFPATFDNTAGALLGSCTQGAFAPVLYCRARATDGYEQLSQYDCQAAIAFALTQPCPKLGIL
jgi:hypothetical protein